MLSLAIESINSAADRWAAWMVAASLGAALLLGLAGLVWLAIRRRVAPQVGCWLFLLVPLKLLLPVDVTVPGSVARWTPSVLVSSWFQGHFTPEVAEDAPPIEPRMAAVGASRHTPLEPPSPARPVPADPPRPTIPSDPPRDMPADSADDARVGPVARARALSLSAGAMIAWLAVVVLLSGRLALAQLRFRARFRHIPPLDESRLAVDVRELCRHAGVAGMIPIVEDDAIAVPSVWGMTRPTILLPRGIARVLTAEQLRWVLLHELAHVRRRDMIVLLLQRLAAILHFFNPAVWTANRVVDQLREYACDDLASAAGRASAVESGEAFVRILQHAARGGRRLEGALGVFGLDTRASCLGRVRRLLDTDRPLRPAPGRWSLGGLVLLAAVSVPHLRAAGETKPDSPQAPAGEAPAASGRDFELQVVGPGGKPVPGAAVEFRTDPSLAAEQIRKGRFARRGPYGTFVATDAEGRLALEFPGPPTGFEFFIQIPGYGPYWASWSHGTDIRAIPPRFTAELEAAWSVGGVIVDAAGKPVEGATIQPSIEFKKRPGLVQQMGSGASAKTDAAGRWHFDSVPSSMAEVFVQINHPGLMPTRRALTRAESGIERGRESTARIVLERGLTVTGKVTDEAGKPIAGALVRTKFLNDIREARTGPDGVYRLAGCEPRSARVVVSAKGRATDMKELNIEPGMGPVDFAMKPGGTVRIRVLDEGGNPVPKTRIFFQRWRGMFKYFEFDHVDQYADDKGMWVWHEAPLDEFKADICPPGRMQLLEQPLIAREDEYVFRLTPDLVVTGKVVDAETKRPIKSFRVVPGIRGSVDHMNWARGEMFSATDGRYEFRPDRGYLAHLVRIEADGYLSAASREIRSTEGNVVVDFELKKGTNVAAKVVTPRNLPAAGARIALGVAGSQINVKNGDIDDSATYSARAEADDAGRFHFPAQDRDFQLVITHPSGFAYIKSPPDWDRTRIIHLEPWCRVEGTFRIGKTPAANVPLWLDVHRVRSYGPDVPSVFTTHEATAGPDGRFVFERVIPGQGRIGRRLLRTVDDGGVDVASACMVAADFPSGKTVRLDLGGTGRAVVGRLRPSDAFAGKVRWNFAQISVRSAEAETRPDSPYLWAAVASDGSFRLDDVPAGDYLLTVRFDRDRAGRLFDHRFRVPSGDAAGPVDLGTLKLEKD